MERACKTCGKMTPLSEYPPNAKSHDGLRSECRPCFRARTRPQRQQWRQKNRERDRSRERAIDPQKKNAVLTVQRAVLRGDLKRPDACERCGRLSSRIEGHHEDYAKPLEIVWLCKPCHWKADNLRREREATAHAC